jgi:23S rRNA (pseudouridine1915-N3)-methyltransferase
VKLLLLTVGKTDDRSLEVLLDDFSRRVNRYVPFDLEAIPDIRSKGKHPTEVIRQREGAEVLRRLQPTDTIWLLDEKGREYTSRGFANHLQKCMNAGPRRLVLVIGGAYGHGQELRSRSHELISLSKMTFNHQVVRLMAVEQLYRAFSILRGDPYHND